MSEKYENNPYTTQNIVEIIQAVAAATSRERELEFANRKLTLELQEKQTAREAEQVSALFSALMTMVPAAASWAKKRLKYHAQMKLAEKQADIDLQELKLETARAASSKSKSEPEKISAKLFAKKHSTKSTYSNGRARNSSTEETSDLS